MQIALDASNRFSFSANELDYHVTTPRPFPRPPPRAARKQPAPAAHRLLRAASAAAAAPLSRLAASSFIRRASPPKLNVVSSIRARIAQSPHVAHLLMQLASWSCPKTRMQKKKHSANYQQQPKRETPKER
jgi:hypothetical protein